MKNKNYIYLVKRTNEFHYDEYDKFVVVSPSEEVAINTNPHTGEQIDWSLVNKNRNCDYGWVTDVKNLEVKLIGVANPDMSKGIVVASFNAG